MAGHCAQAGRAASRCGRGRHPVGSVRVIVVHCPIVVGMVVVVRVPAGVQIVGAVPVLAVAGAVTVLMRVRMRMLVCVDMRMRVRMVQVAVPVPVLVAVLVRVRVLMKMVVRVAGGVDGLVVRHSGLRMAKVEDTT